MIAFAYTETEVTLQTFFNVLVAKYKSQDDVDSRLHSISTGHMPSQHAATTERYQRLGIRTYA
jgi:hypothetical protein